MADGLLVEIDGAIATLTLDRPAALNALTVPLKVALLEALMSIAAYKGLWQLIHNPFYWEKTQHGISRYTAAELAEAAQ